MIKITHLILGLGFLSAIQTAEAQDIKKDSLEAYTDSIFKELPEVMIKGERPVVKAKKGMLEYDMPRLIANRPVNNIYEALRELPGVVDMDESLSLGGRSMTIIINGKVSTLSTDQLYALLKSMPPSRLEKAEVMYAAPARYQVRGAAINLILKSETDNPSSLQGEVFGEWRQKHYGEYTDRGSFIYSSKKFSTDFLYSYEHGHQLNISNKEAIHILNDGTQYQMNTDGRNVYKSEGNNARLGMDYAFGKDYQLSLVYTAQWNNNNNTAATWGDETASARHKANSDLHNLRLDYSLPFHLKVGAEYTHYNNPGTQTLSSILGDEQININSHEGQRINKLKLSAGQDIVLPKDWTINFGGFYVTSNDHSFQSYYDAKTGELIPDNSMASVHREKTTNIYSGLSKNFGSKLSAEASLTAENYHTDIWNEWALFPTFSLNYTPKDGHMLQASLSSDRSYPSFWSVQNITSYVSAYSEIQGNPDLKPSLDYSADLTYMLLNKYMFTLYASNTKDFFTQQLYQQPDKLREVYKFFNMDYNRQAGIRVSMPFTALNRIDGRFTAIGFYDRQRCSHFWDTSFDRKIHSFMLILNNTVTVSRKPDIKFMLYGFYQNGMIQGLFDLPRSGNLDASLRWMSNNQKFTVTAKCNDIFDTSSISPRMTIQGQYVVNKYSACQRTFVVSLSYKFGNYKEKRRGAIDTSRFK